ncbi:hypothetical protein THAOC_12418, partial [Thalassiosira oceanica]
MSDKSDESDDPSDEEGETKAAFPTSAWSKGSSVIASGEGNCREDRIVATIVVFQQLSQIDDSSLLLTTEQRLSAGTLVLPTNPSLDTGTYTPPLRSLHSTFPVRPRKGPRRNPPPISYLGRATAPHQAPGWRQSTARHTKYTRDTMGGKKKQRSRQRKVEQKSKGVDSTKFMKRVENYRRTLSSATPASVCGALGDKEA